jgi:hypothetical protein
VRQDPIVRHARIDSYCQQKRSKEDDHHRVVLEISTSEDTHTQRMMVVEQSRCLYAGEGLPLKIDSGVLVFLPPW